jgi:hypothetical protein
MNRDFHRILKGAVLLALALTQVSASAEVFRVDATATGANAQANSSSGSARFCTGTLEIVKRREVVKGFRVLPKRWIAERTFAWLGC